MTADYENADVDYTVVPAAPGTFLLVASIDIEEGAEPEFHRYPVVAWRVPTRNTEAPVAQLYGYEPGNVYRGGVVEFNGRLETDGLLLADGATVQRGCDRWTVAVFEAHCGELLKQQLAERLRRSA